jgi:hypothetical protein
MGTMLPYGAYVILRIAHSILPIALAGNGSHYSAS